jgi:hypothetical protein
MTLAYAITTHKAQGSQFPRVVIPVYRSRILDRTLLYTAVTRAQLQVVLAGDRDTYKMAIRNSPIRGPRLLEFPSFSIEVLFVEAKSFASAENVRGHWTDRGSHVVLFEACVSGPLLDNSVAAGWVSAPNS